MISAALLCVELLVVGSLLALLLFLIALWQAPWVELLSDLRRQHLLFGAAFALFCLWLLRRDFDSGLSYHLMGLTAVTLLLDWPLALLCGALAQFGMCLLGKQDLASLGINSLLFVMLPVWVAHLCARQVERRQPQNLFVYIFFCGFFPAALTVLVCALCGIAVLWLCGLFSFPAQMSDLAAYLWLVMFPEAFINGLVVTALVVFVPHWLDTFNRTRYLQAPWHQDR